MENTAMPAITGAPCCGACFSLGESCLTNCFWAPYFKLDDSEKFSLLIDGTTPACFKAMLRQSNPAERQQFIDNLYKEKKEKSEQEKAKAVLAADSVSLNQHKGKTVVDVAEDSSNHCKWWAAKSARTKRTESRYPKRGVHDSGFKWASKRARTKRTESCYPKRGVHDSGIKWARKRARTRTELKAKQAAGQLLLFAEILEAADTLLKMANGVDQKAKAKQAEKEEASLRNEKAEQSEKEEASLKNKKAEQAEKEHADQPEK